MQEVGYSHAKLTDPVKVFCQNGSCVDKGRRQGKPRVVAVVKRPGSGEVWVPCIRCRELTAIILEDLV